MPTTTPRRPAPRRATARRTPPTARPSIPGRRKQAPPSRGGQLLGLVSKALPPAVATKKAAKKGGSKGRNLALLGIAGGLAAAIKKRNAKQQQPEVAVPPVPPAPTPTPATAA